MNSLGMICRYRPVRVGWCVRHGDFAALRRAVRMSYALWGGRYNPIIPVGEPSEPESEAFADRLVEAFRADMLYPVLTNLPAGPTGTSALLETFVARYPHLEGPLLGEMFTSTGNGRTRCQLLDIHHPVARVYRELQNIPAEARLVIDIFGWQETDPLADVLLMTHGAFPTGDAAGDIAGATTPEANLARAGRLSLEFVTRNLFTRQVNLLPEQSIDIRPPGRWDLSTISSAYVEMHHAIEPPRPEPGYYVGSAASFDDLVNFWNLRAEGIDLRFLDPDHMPRFNGPVRAEALILRQPRWTRAGASPPSVALWSRNTAEQPVPDMEIFGGPVLRYRADQDTWAGGHARLPIFHFAESEVLGTISSKAQSTSRVAFLLPEKPGDRALQLDNQRLMVSVSPSPGAQGLSGETFETFYVPKLNEFYGQRMTYAPMATRVEPDALGVMIWLGQTSFELQAAPIADLTAAIFASAEVEARNSQPGLVARQLIQQMGGLQECAVFKVTGVRKLIENFGPDKSFTTSTAMQMIRDQDAATGTIGFDRFKRLNLETRKPGTQLNTDQVWRHLLGKGVFRTGLEFRCPRCELDFWITLDDARTETACAFCGSSFNIAPQLRDRDWRFRRTGLFGRDDHQGGAIAVFLTLLALSAVTSPNLLYTTATELEFLTRKGLRCETDFVALAKLGLDYRTTVVIGETKTRGEITDDDVRNLGMVANALPSSLFDVYIAFSKLGEFSPEEVARIRTLNIGRRPRVTLLRLPDLEAVDRVPALGRGTTGGEVRIDDLAGMAGVTAERLLV